MNGIDYRIHSRREELSGRITKVLPDSVTPSDYCSVRLSDARVLRFVKYVRSPTDDSPLVVGEQVRLTRQGGAWLLLSRGSV